MAGDETYRNMDEDAYDLLAEYTASEEMISMRKYKGEDGRIDMCQGLKDWAAEEREIGRSEGIEKGIEQTRVVSLRNIIKQLNYSTEQALQLLLIPEEEWVKYKELV